MLIAMSLTIQFQYKGIISCHGDVSLYYFYHLKCWLKCVQLKWIKLRKGERLEQTLVITSNPGQLDHGEREKILIEDFAMTLTLKRCSCWCAANYHLFFLLLWFKSVNHDHWFEFFYPLHSGYILTQFFSDNCF